MAYRRQEEWKIILSSCTANWNELYRRKLSVYNGSNFFIECHEGFSHIIYIPDLIYFWSRKFINCASNARINMK